MREIRQKNELQIRIKAGTNADNLNSAYKSKINRVVVSAGDSCTQLVTFYIKDLDWDVVIEMERKVVMDVLDKQKR